ncbi:MAG: bifunctional lysine ketoglutarate reductase /saccharopine dehydrogenase family protein [Bacteroidales bacterium]|jgi:hypothetical protein|nr:bifunctional lysine ketoglutarate reductase /saccharopine dehydrogenase family protein [Bacteroidales bacterium]MDD3755993.1 bifunctional lysine ketoglutarate reductase /saccharopine dehydrogenase family protein [Bacteroidales bacterium]MDI9575519.1 bifunctional lysine ketoglutarate reductase /saccharopine dehydrogenase family protein [Bacteroidota bacterium]HHW59846.1 hypothetical protein [Bacteroidales bacterium]
MILGIRAETKYPSEKRVAVIPEHVNKLVKQGFKVLVQSSNKRIFTDEEYEKAGAKIVNSLEQADIIIGIKEIPEEEIYADKVYLFFSHTIKGQKHNIPMLKQLIKQRATLIDYEKIVDDFGKRLIFFGNYAGNAGLVDTLWMVGKRLVYKGIANPFDKLKRAFEYSNLDNIIASMSEIGFDILKNGLPESLIPFIIGITGYGNVSKGVQEILHFLPVKEILPEDLKRFSDIPPSPHHIYKVVFKEKDMVKRRDGGKFDLNDYYLHPENYESIFYQYLPYLNVLIHASYWDQKYPRVVEEKYIIDNWGKPDFRLLGIGDISCDINGGVEITKTSTEVENPVLIYNPATRDYIIDLYSEGLPVLAVDILPTELPMDASTYFSSILLPYIEALLKANWKKNFNKLEIPLPLKRGTILYKGKFTPDYEYMKQFINNNQKKQ